MAEGIARKWFTDHGLTDAVVFSAGLMRGGVSAASDAIRACEAMSVDISAHVSQQVTTELLGKADVVLCMERMHIRELAVTSRDTLARMFTLREFVRRSQEAPRRDGESVRAWCARLSARRAVTTLMSSRQNDDDIADPMGRGYEHFAKTAWELSECVQSACKLLAAHDLGAIARGYRGFRT